MTELNHNTDRDHIIAIRESYIHALEVNPPENLEDCTTLQEKTARRAITKAKERYSKYLTDIDADPTGCDAYANIPVLDD
jgi:hypothetical protein